MGPSLLITLREGLEAALIVAVVLAYLHRMDYRRGARAVWWGVAGAVAVSLLGGALLVALGLTLEGRAEEVFEGVTMLVAVGVLGWMVVWMKHQARHIKRHLEAQVRSAMLKGSTGALAGVAFFAVGREGLETALFMFAAYQAATPMQTVVGGLIGLGLAVAMGVVIYRGSRLLNLRVFFNVTGVLLIFVAAGLLARGIHELQEAALLPVFVEHVWDSSRVLNEDGGVGLLLQSLLGYNANPSLVEVLAYIGFVATSLLYFFRAAPASPAPTTVASGPQHGT